MATEATAATATHEVHLELLLGKPVLDPDGKTVGRVEEVRAREEGEEWVVTEYMIGPAALVERLSAWSVGGPIKHALARVFGREAERGYLVPWDKLDLSDPASPRLLCSPDELTTFSEHPSGKG
jgi:sporulation protein YlmC with PRC-barrel domain